MKTITAISQLGLKKSSNLLVIMPHPDDEAVFCSGLMSMAVQTHIPVTLICITKGEHSTHRFGLKSTDDLVAVRKQEQIRAAHKIGATLIWGDVEDGTIAHNINLIRPWLQKQIERYRPDWLLTLEPDGIYGHPDHIALSQVVTKLAHNNHCHLLYATVPPEFVPSQGARNMAQKALIKPLAPAFRLSLRPEMVKLKKEVCNLHYSQLGENEEFQAAWKKYGLFESEYYALG